MEQWTRSLNLNLALTSSLLFSPLFLNVQMKLILFLACAVVCVQHAAAGSPSTSVVCGSAMTLLGVGEFFSWLNPLKFTSRKLQGDSFGCTDGEICNCGGGDFSECGSESEARDKGACELPPSKRPGLMPPASPTQ
ncbi:unnamed protein product [Chrysoparadoxa australica]